MWCVMGEGVACAGSIERRRMRLNLGRGAPEGVIVEEERSGGSATGAETEKSDCGDGKEQQSRVCLSFGNLIFFQYCCCIGLSFYCL